MNRTMRALFSLVLTLVLVVALATPAFAATASITYKGQKDQFVFDPSTDLFRNFKGVMPGDTLEQSITFTNKSTDSNYVKLYVRAVAHDTSNPLTKPVKDNENIPSMEDFLSQLDMEVYCGKKQIFKASPDELGGMKNKVLLGTFKKNASATLTVKLNVPIELGNEYANRMGEVDWIFTVEAFKGTPSTSDDRLIQTGQLNWPILALGAGGLVFLILGGTMVLSRKKRKNAE
ncbi:MAG: LPXTG cell wall anchor domain-containing protein [Clostridiales bacterium]|nr:LPXTG cell wall anchor domain-containing protein [Clostridiales bacterium]